jgi:ATP-binding cassette subfamily B protein
MNRAARRLPRLLSAARRGSFARLLLIGALQGCVMVATALLTQRAFDGYMFVGAPLSGLRETVAALVAIAIASAALRAWEVVAAEQLGQSYVHDTRQRLFHHLYRLNARRMRGRALGPLMMRFISDMSAMRQWVSLGVARMIVALTMMIGAFAVLVVLSPALAGIVAAAGASAAVASALLGKPLQHAIRRARRRRTALANNIAGKTTAMPVVQAHGQFRREAQRLARQSKALANEMVNRAVWIGALRAVADAAVRLTTAAVLAFGAWAVSQSAATAGTVVAAMAIVALLLPSVRDLGRVHEYWRNASIAREKAEAFLASGPLLTESRHARPLADGRGEVRFVDVTLTPLTQPFSARVAPGRRIAITGDNGAGKSTLLWLAARLLDPDTGHVQLDGSNLKDVQLESLRAAIGIVSSDLPILRGSVKRNLLYRAPRASAREIERVWRACGLDALIEALPDGLETRLLDDARNLSTGQRMRLALARALLGDPRLLLLDEADANLDAPTRALLAKIVGEYPGTVLMVTHDPQLIEIADETWVVGDGRVAVTRGGAASTAANVVDFKTGATP